jgi:hypothetical protein
MKDIKSLVKGIYLVILVIVFFGGVECDASEYLGDYCWKFNTPTSERIMKLGVFHLGGTHFSLVGQAPNSEGIQRLVSGNAEFLGDRIEITLNYFTSPPGAGTEVSNLLLDPVSLNGTARVINTYVNDENTFNKIEYYGPINFKFVPCP